MTLTESLPEASSARSKRDRILRAAQSVCVERGLDAARMDEIAGAARVSKGTLYRFFASKEDLLLASVINAYEQGEARVASLLPSVDDPGEQLEGTLRALLEVFASIATDMGFLQQAAALVARDAVARERLRVALRGIYAARSERLVAILGHGKRTGVFQPDVDVGAFSSAVLAIFDGFLYRATFESHERVRAELEQSFLGMAASIRRPPARDASAGSA